MTEAKTGAEPFLREMRRLEISEEYERILQERNRNAKRGQVKQAADKASELLMPLVTEVDAGSLPYIRVHTIVDGLTFQIYQEAKEIKG